MKFSDVDYINRTLKVQRQLGKKIGSSKEDFAPKTFGKQEVRLKTSSSYREIPIPDYVFEAILEQRKIYEQQKRRRSSTLLLKNDFNPKAVSKLMGHAKELITMDVYGDKRGILADCVDELQAFIEEALPNADQDNVLVAESMDGVIDAKSYLS